MDKAIMILNNALESDDEQIKANAIKRLEKNEEILPETKLIEFLKDENIYVSNVALQIAEKRKDESLIPAIISNLSNIKTSLQARQTLKVFSKNFIIQSFKDLLSKEDLSRSLRLGIIRALREYDGHTSIDILISQLSHNDQDIYNEVIDSLIICARINQLDEKELEILAKEIQKLPKNYTQ